MQDVEKETKKNNFCKNRKIKNAMIKEVKMFGLFCDKCGKLYMNEDTGYCAFVSDADALKDAQEGEWKEIEGRMLCPDCYHYDEDADEYFENAKEEV